MKKFLILFLITSSSFISRLWACSCSDLGATSFCDILSSSNLSQEITIIDKNDTIAFAKVLHTVSGTYDSDIIKLRIYPKKYSTYTDPSSGLTVKYEIINSCGFSEAAHSNYVIGDTILAAINPTEIDGIYQIFHNICNTNFQYKKDGTYTALGDCPISEVLGNKDFISEEKLSLYPNPAQNFIHLNKSSTYSIYSARGEFIHQYKNSKDLDLSSLKPGLYILKEEEVISPKTIKFILE